MDRLRRVRASLSEPDPEQARYAAMTASERADWWLERAESSSAMAVAAAMSIAYRMKAQQDAVTAQVEALNDQVARLASSAAGQES